MPKAAATAPAPWRLREKRRGRRRLLGGPALGKAGAQRRTAALRATRGAILAEAGARAAQGPLPGEELGVPVSGVSVQQGEPRRRQMTRRAAAGLAALLVDPCGSTRYCGQPRSSAEERRRADPFRATAISGARRPSWKGRDPFRVAALSAPSRGCLNISTAGNKKFK